MFFCKSLDSSFFMLLLYFGRSASRLSAEDLGGGLAQIISGFVAFDTGYRFKKRSMTFAVFLSLGGNFYFKPHEHEFYLAATAVINFADN